jgi:hypothetical protein
MNRLHRVLLCAALLLAGSISLLAVVTVIPDATPVPKAKPKPKPKATPPRQIAKATPTPKAPVSPLVGTWQGTEQGLITLRIKKKTYQQRSSIVITLVVPPGLQTVSGSYGAYSSEWIGAVPPKNERFGSASPRAFGPYPVRLNGNSLEWTDVTGGSTVFSVTLAPGPNGTAQITERSSNVISEEADVSSEEHGTLTRLH